jgi:hypothetical protein
VVSHGASPPVRPLQAGLSMIIVSDSSADATQPARIGRYTAACSRSSATHDDTHRYTDARPISVHTKEVTSSIPVSPTSERPDQRPARSFRPRRFA